MDRLRSPGGCPWDREQTHLSLAPYALEEAHELVDAIETGTRADLRSELGDVLLQVVFHARIAQEDADDPFDLEAVAHGCADKLIERHPHVFADGDADTAADVRARWEDLKSSTMGRESSLDGIPATLGALARAQKVVARAARLGVTPSPDAEGLGADLLRAVAVANRAGVDAEAALRAATRALEDQARAAEQGA